MKEANIQARERGAATQAAEKGENPRPEAKEVRPNEDMLAGLRGKGITTAANLETEVGNHFFRVCRPPQFFRMLINTSAASKPYFVAKARLSTMPLGWRNIQSSKLSVTDFPSMVCVSE